jgi:hypothetical protein
MQAYFSHQFRSIHKIILVFGTEYNHTVPKKWPYIYVGSFIHIKLWKIQIFSDNKAEKIKIL